MSTNQRLKKALERHFGKDWENKQSFLDLCRDYPGAFIFDEENVAVEKALRCFGKIKGHFWTVQGRDTWYFFIGLSLEETEISIYKECVFVKEGVPRNV